MQRYVQLRPAIGVSQPCSGAHAISTALGQANQALVASFYGAGARWYGTEEAALQERLPPEAEAFAQALPELLAQPEALEAAYRQALARFPQTRTLPGVVLRWLQDCDMRAGVQRPFKVYGGLTNLTDYDGCLDAYLERARALADSRLPQGLSPQIAAAVRYLQGHFTGPVTLGDAAEAAGFHPSYFSTVFKHEMGVGFSDYLTELRLERVKEQLVQSGDTIKEIAQQAGFYDYQHFCKTFKKKVGQSPAAYRKQISKENTTT
jgi:two-component system response regulator YesN